MTGLRVSRLIRYLRWVQRNHGDLLCVGDLDDGYGVTNISPKIDWKCLPDELGSERSLYSNYWRPSGTDPRIQKGEKVLHL